MSWKNRRQTKESLDWTETGNRQVGEGDSMSGARQVDDGADALDGVEGRQREVHSVRGEVDHRVQHHQTVEEEV